MKKIRELFARRSAKKFLAVAMMTVLTMSMFILPCWAATGSTTVVDQAPMDMAEGITMFGTFVDMLWSYIVTAVSWILTPALWILLVPFLAYMSVVAAAVLKSLVKGA